MVLLYCEISGGSIISGLSLIIPTYQNVSGLRLVLESIHYASCPMDFEVLVVANLQDPEVERLAATFPHVRYLFTGVVGVNHARNLGIQHAKYEFSYFFDDDCVLMNSDFFNCLMTELNSMLSAKSFVGGPYLLQPECSVYDRAYSQIQQQWLQQGLLDASGRCAFLLGGNFGGRTQEMQKHLFDPKIIFGGSETEFFLRLHRIGYSCRLSHLLPVQHQTSLTAWKLLNKAYKQGRGAAYLRRLSLDFQSNYFHPVLKLEKNPTVLFWQKMYRVAFQISYLSHLPQSIRWQWARSRILNFLQKPELLRRNLMSRVVALIGLHLNSKK